MNQVNCPVCGNKCIKAGKTKAGSQRWLCRKCNSSVTHKIDNSAKELQIFLDWLFGKESQSSMPGDGRTFRRKTAKYWNIWPIEYSCAMKSHFRKIGNQMSGSGNHLCEFTRVMFYLDRIPLASICHVQHQCL